MVITQSFSFFPPLAYCLTFFVSKFQGSKSNSLSVALIWSTSCIHGFDWKNWLFINTFIFILLSFLNDLSCRYQIGLKSKIIWGSFFLQLPSSVFQSVCQSVCLSFHLSLCLSIHLKIGSTFPNGDYALVRGFCITILAQCLKQSLHHCFWLHT